MNKKGSNYKSKLLCAFVCFVTCVMFFRVSAISFVKSHEYPKADAIIFIDIRPETSMKRKMKEHGRLDKHEKDLGFLKKVKNFYLKEIKETILGKWFIIDGERSIEEVHEDIVKIISKMIE